MYYSKSDYLLFKQCPKSLWLKRKYPGVLSDIPKSKLEKGNEVTEAARNLFPNGSLVPYSSNLIEMVEFTKELLQSGETTIYEAAFLWEEFMVICDILHRDENGWKIYEVKSSTEIKERHIDDATFQLYVIRQNLPVHSIHIVHLNNKYIRTGNLEIEKLFTKVNVTEDIKDQLISIPLEVIKMIKVDLLEDAPPQVIGIHCNKYSKDDFECAAKGHCWSHLPDYSVFDISRIGKRAFDLYYDGIVSILDIPLHYKLSDAQKIQVEAYRKNLSILEINKIREFLSTLRFPLYFLDFETFQQAIPLFDGVAPFQQLPFQYSLHILNSMEEEAEHREFLAKEGTDPRRDLAERLVHDIPKGVCTLAYNMSFEKMVLKGLVNQFPDLEDHLMDIHDHMVDLMVPFQKKWYYLNEMKGRYSIKYVLPALDNSLSYQNLNIRNGSMAMETFERLHTYPKEKIDSIRNDLLEYCKMDTLAMTRIWEKLSEATLNSGS